MTFLTPQFFCFFPVTALVFFLLPRRARNPWLLLASWFFYLCAKPIYLAFLLFTIAASYLTGRLLERSRSKGTLAACLVILGLLLFVFKYLNFALSLAGQALSALGFSFSAPVLDILMPVGISFYLFQAMGYVIDVYRGKVPAERDLLLYALFLSFFPQIVSGPIARADQLLPQFKAEHRFDWDEFRAGLFRFLWGAFKKLVLAALLTKALQRVLQMYAHFYVSGALALLSYAILYVDLSGYSDIAIAVGSFMGIPVPENFKKPWTAASFTQFWRKWHVTLSDFIREHIFVVVNGKRLNRWISAGIGLLTMLVMSLWHEFSLMALCTGLYMGGLLALENVLGLTTVDKRRTPKALYVFRCLIVLGLFSINAMFFTMSGSQILWAIGGFFKL